MRKTIREWVEESNASHIQLAMPDMRDLYRKSKGKWQRFALGRTGSGLRGKPGFEGFNPS